MSEEIEVLKQVCKALENAAIPYMLTGSLAANFYAVPRMTRDIDFVIEIQNVDIMKFLRIFQDDFYVSKESIVEAVQHESMFNIIHNRYVIKIDFVVRKDAAYRAVEFERRRRIQLDNIQIWIVSPEDLIISKLFWAKDSQSDFQLRDVKNLLQSGQRLDPRYLAKWIQTLGLNQIFEKANK